MRLGSARADHRRAAQHDARGPRRDPARLLRTELERHGFEGVDIAFDAPSRDWSGQLSKPTVNLFLYDLREAEALRTSEWSRIDRATAAAFESRPPMVMECSYAVTAWTQAVEDEHRLLSQVLAILFAYPAAPRGPRSTGASPTARSRGRSRAASGRARARSRTSGARSAASTRSRSTTSCGFRSSPAPSSSAGPKSARRPSARGCGRPPRTVLEMHRSVGRVATRRASRWPTSGSRCPTSAPGRRAPPTGASASTACRPGQHRLLARTADGREADAQLRSPELASTW